VASLPVVEDLQVLKDRVGEVDASGPPLTIQQFCLHARSEGPDHGVVVGVTDGAHRRQQPGVLGALGERPRSELPCEPWSLWISVCSGRGLRLVMAMRRALVTSGVAWWLLIAQPTTRGKNTCSTTQQSTLPSRVGAR
jgi:hypothetical protein